MLKNPMYRKTMKTKTKQVVNNLEKIFQAKYWKHQENSREKSRNNETLVEHDFQKF